MADATTRHALAEVSFADEAAVRPSLVAALDAEDQRLARCLEAGCALST